MVKLITEYNPKDIETISYTMNCIMLSHSAITSTMNIRNGIFFANVQMSNKFPPKSCTKSEKSILSSKMSREKIQQVILFTITHTI